MNVFWRSFVYFLNSRILSPLAHIYNIKQWKQFELNILDKHHLNHIRKMEGILGWTKKKGGTPEDEVADIPEQKRRKTIFDSRDKINVPRLLRENGGCLNF